MVPGFMPWESEECRFARGLRAEATLTRRTEIFWLGGQIHMGNRVQRHRYISPTFHFSPTLILKPKLRITAAEKKSLPFSSQDAGLVFCIDVGGLMTDMRISEYPLGKWRFFIDSSKLSLRSVQYFCT
ncbi:hypothetical protein BsWGS_23723 [Bradybaena similaris]